MATRIGGIFADFALDAAGFNADIKKTSAVVRSSSARMNQSLAKLERGFDRAGAGVARIRKASVALGAVFAGVAAAGIGGFIKSTTASGAQLIDTADKIGLTTDRLQELQHAAASSGVDVNVLNLGMQRFTRRVAEAQAGAGELKGTLDQYGIALRDSTGKARSQVAVLNDVADAIKNASTRQEALRIAFKAFDSEGAALVNTLRDGAAGLQAYADEAHDLGAVIDRDALEAARRFDTALNILWRTTLVGVKAAIFDVILEIESLAQAIGLLEKPIDVRIMTNTEEIYRLEDQLARLKAGRDELADRGGLFGGRSALNAADKVIAERSADLAKLREETEALIAQAQAAPRLAPVVVTADRLPAESPVTKASAGPARDAAADAAERERLRIRELIGEIQFETKLLGESREDREVMNALRRAGADATDGERIAIEHLIRAKSRQAEAFAAAEALAQHDAQQLVAQQQQIKAANDNLNTSFQDLGLQGLQAFGALATGAGDWKQALLGLIPVIGKVILKVIELQQAQAAAGGGSGGFFSTLLSFGTSLISASAGGGGVPTQGNTAVSGFGVMHSGGTVGRPTRMRRPGPRGDFALASDEVPTILQAGETVIPKSGGGGFGGVTIHQNISIDARGNEDIEARLARATEEGARRGADMAVAQVARRAGQGGGYARAVGRR